MRVAGSGAGWTAAPCSSLLGYQRVGTARQGPQQGLPWAGAQDHPAAAADSVMPSGAGREGERLCGPGPRRSRVREGGHLVTGKQPMDRSGPRLSGRLPARLRPGVYTAAEAGPFQEGASPTLPGHMGTPVRHLCFPAQQNLLWASTAGTEQPSRCVLTSNLLDGRTDTCRDLGAELGAGGFCPCWRLRGSPRAPWQTPRLAPRGWGAALGHTFLF